MQPTNPRTAEAATLGHNLVYESAYGVRSDGIAFISSYDNALWYETDIVNTSGEVTFSTKDSGLDLDDGPVMDKDFLDGNLIVTKEGPYYDVGEGEDAYTDNVYYGVINPHNGKIVIDPIYQGYDNLIKECEKQGMNTRVSDDVQKAWDDYVNTEGNFPICTLPNGKKAYEELIGDWDSGKWVIADSSKTPLKIAGFDLGHISWDQHGVKGSPWWNGLFRTNKQGKSMYYVTNSAGKVGAVEENGKVVIPFNYDDYYDAKAGSDLILLKKGNAWEFFDLNSVGYGSNSNQDNNSNNSSNNKPGSFQPGTTITKSGKWIKSGNRWWYRVSDGTYPANTVVNINKKTYRFDAKGYMRTGWIKENGNWYYHNKSGAQVSGWTKVGGKWYYLNSKGIMQTGKKKIGNATYYLASSGAMKIGWQKISNNWYYFASNGAMKTGWTKVKSKWYFMDSAGKMKTGWLDNGGKRYLLRPSSGEMITGWARADGKWYYFNKSGYMQKSKWIGNYYVGTDGKMLTNQWVKTNGKEYYVNKAGKWTGAKR